MSTPANLRVHDWQFATPITGGAHEAWPLVGTLSTSYEGAVDTDYAVIFKLGNTGEMADNDDYQLQYDINASETWNNVNATSSFVRSAASGDTDDATSTTERLPVISGTTYDLSNLDEVDGLQIQNIGGLDSHEFYFTFNTRSAELSGGDSIRFRLIATSDSSVVALDGISIFPTMTMPAGTVPGAATFTINNMDSTSDKFISSSCPASFNTNNTSTGDNSLSASKSVSYNLSNDSAGDQLLSSLQSILYNTSLNYTKDNSLVSPQSVSYNTILGDVSANTATLSASIAYINQLAQNQDKLVSLNAALAFILQIAQQQAGEIVIPLEINLAAATNFILENVLSGQKEITIGTLLDQFSQNNLEAYKNATFNINLIDTYDVTAISTITGTTTFGTTLAYTTNNVSDIFAAANVNVVLDKAEQVNLLLEENANFNFSLTFAPDTFGVVILDDPVWSISSGEYIFVDLTNIPFYTPIKSAQITFTTQQGQTQTVGLIGQAAQAFLVQLIQNQSIDGTIAGEVPLAISLDQAAVTSLIQLVQFSATLNLDELSDNQIETLKTAVYLANLSQNQTVLATGEKTLDLSTVLDFNAISQLIGSVNVNIGATLNYLSSIKTDLNTAINFLSTLDFINEGDTGITAISNFNLNLLVTDQVQSILGSTISLIKSMSQASDKQAILNKAIAYLIQLSETASTELLGAVSFILQLQNVNTETITADKAAAIIVNTAEQYNVTLTTAETLALVIQLADSYSATASLPAEITLTNSMQQIQSTLVDKLTTVSFALALTQVNTSKVDFNTFTSLITTFVTSFLGEATGKIDGNVTFASQISQGNTSISAYNKNVSFLDLLSVESLSNLEFYKNLNIILQLDQTQAYDFGKTGEIIFNTFYSKLDTVKSDFVPSIDFNLQAIDTSKANKDMLTNALLGMENSLINSGTIGFTSLIDFGIQQGYETELRLTAEGDLQLTTQLSESNTLQYLGQTGITFGHLLGLAALSRAEFVESIAFGTISDLQVEGFVLKFTITLPDSRTLKVYFEDRLTIIYPEDRIIKVT